MDLDQLAALRTAAGESALAAATDLVDAEPLAAATALRSAGIPAELASAALTQAELRRRATAKFGADAARMLFTRAGLEQATRSNVAARRAARLVAAGVSDLVDLGCGLGADTIAAARAGIAVRAVEADPVTAAITGHNLAVLGLDAEVTCADARSVDLTGVGAAFCDPARRKGSRRVFDPADYSPPWDWVSALPQRVARTVLKLAPGIDPGLLPDGCELELVSVDGDVVEAAAWCGPFARVPRRATLLRSTGAVHELTGSGAELAPVGETGGYLYDPDGAVVRAHLVAEFAATIGGRLADPTIAYVWTDRPTPTPYARCLAVDEVLAFSLKRLRTALRERGVGRVELLKRGSALDVEQLRRDLRLSGPNGASVVLTRVTGRPVAVVARPL